MALHVARIGFNRISSTGSVLTEGATIQDVVTSSSELRVQVDAAIPNSAGNPTVPQYLIDEEGDGFILQHMDQTYIVTRNPS